MIEKIAILSDIHSNVFALEAVLDHGDRLGVTQWLNLGDILYGPIAPRATFELLQRYPFQTIQGNQDRQVYQKLGLATNPTLQFILADLGQTPLDWLAALPSSLQINDELFACHGTPDNDEIYLLEDVNSGVNQLRKDSEISELLRGNQMPWILCGHTHIPRHIQLASGQQIVNPGSVGLPSYQDDLPVPHSMESGSPHARFCVMTQVNSGWQVEFHQVPYDFEGAIKQARKNGREDWCHYLASGRT